MTAMCCPYSIQAWARQYQPGDFFDVSAHFGLYLAYAELRWIGSDGRYYCDLFLDPDHTERKTGAASFTRGGNGSYLKTMAMAAVFAREKSTERAARRSLLLGQPSSRCPSKRRRTVNDRKTPPIDVFETARFAVRRQFCGSGRRPCPPIAAKRGASRRATQ
jgi:hypothetical protein